jgi:hypothetical protein
MKAEHGTLTAWVVLTKPIGAKLGWEQSELVTSAESIPDALLYVDNDAVETRLFGPVTSGHVLVYDPAGRLVFSGGLTPGRGEAGASASVDRLLQAVQDRPGQSVQAPVFGCPLLDVIP